MMFRNVVLHNTEVACYLLRFLDNYKCRDSIKLSLA